MQIKKSKFLIGTLLSVVSIGAVGSITGTYAWYTYNTKDTLVYHGIAAADNENLEFRVKTKTGYGEWKTAIATQELSDASASNGFAGTALEPVSFNTKQLKNYKLEPFVGKYEQFVAVPPTEESATKPYYFQVELQFRCLSVEDTPVGLSRDIYLSRLNVTATTSGKDITKALRIHFDDNTATLDNKTLVAPAQNSGTMNLYGTYDMDGDGKIDHGFLQEPASKGIYEKDPTGTAPGAVDVPYGDHTGKPTESWYGKNDVLATFNGREYKSGGRKIVRTDASTTSFKTVVMTIWIDGWDAACINQNAKSEFDLDIQFQSAKIAA